MTIWSGFMFQLKGWTKTLPRSVCVCACVEKTCMTRELRWRANPDCKPRLLSVARGPVASPGATHWQSVRSDCCIWIGLDYNPFPLIFSPIFPELDWIWYFSFFFFNKNWTLLQKVHSFISHKLNFITFIAWTGKVYYTPWSELRLSCGTRLFILVNVLLFFVVMWLCLL